VATFALLLIDQRLNKFNLSAKRFYFLRCIILAQGCSLKEQMRDKINGADLKRPLFLN